MDPVRPRAILLTGASSGIGAALARAYAAPGVVLHLGGRDGGRLDAVAEDCRRRGAEARPRLQDVTDRPAMAAWIAEAFGAGPVELVVANAGISGGTGRAERDATESAAPMEDAGQIDRLFAVNVEGVVNTVLPAIREMLDRPAPGRGLRGQIAVMSSLAGFRGLPGAPAYCASKAAVRTLGEGLRPLLSPRRIALSVVCPGFVRSPMTEGNPYPMPFLMDSARAAAVIRRGLARNRARIAFPWRLYALIRLLGALPPGTLDPVLARLPGKPTVAD